MSFIRDYVNKLDYSKLSQLLMGLKSRRMRPAELAMIIQPNKKKRFDASKKIIAMHMPRLLDEQFNENNFLPRDQDQSWDEYLLNVHKSSDTDLQAVLKKYDDMEENPSGEKIKELKDLFTKWIETGITRGGLNTAFLFIFGFLRVIPILWKQSNEDPITKEQLIAIVNGKSTMQLIFKNMSISVGSLLVLQNVLWQQRVDTLSKARDKISYIDNDVLISMHTFSLMNRLFNPDNFQLKDSGLEFSESGECYLKAAQGNFQEVTLGCPAKTQYERYNPFLSLFNHLEKIIRSIPDEKFKKLMASPVKPFDEIRQGFNDEYSIADGLKSRRRQLT